MEIIPIGTNCGTSQLLKKYNVREDSNYFDWEITLGLSVINNILENDNLIEDIKDIEYFENIKIKENIQSIFNGKTNYLIKYKKIHGLLSRHFDTSNKDDYEMYIRRIERLYEKLNNKDKKIIFIRNIKLKNEIKDNLNKLDIYEYDNFGDNYVKKVNNEIKRFFEILKNKYNRDNDLLLFQAKDKKYNSKLIKHKNFHIFYTNLEMMRFVFILINKKMKKKYIKKKNP